MATKIERSEWEEDSDTDGRESPVYFDLDNVNTTTLNAGISEEDSGHQCNYLKPTYTPLIPGFENFDSEYLSSFQISTRLIYEDESEPFKPTLSIQLEIQKPDGDEPEAQSPEPEEGVVLCQTEDVLPELEEVKPEAEEERDLVDLKPLQSQLGSRPRNEHTCETCGRKFIGSHCLTNHMKSHERESNGFMKKARQKEKTRRYPCGVCGTIFSKRLRLSHHQAKVHSEKNVDFSHVFCALCGRSFAGFQYLMVHKNKAHGGASLDEEQMDDLSDGLDDNGQMDEDDVSITFRDVDVTFGENEASPMEIHASEPKLVDASDEKRFCCETCGAVFSKQSRLSSHQRTHTGEKPYACPSCGKVFVHSSHLRRHQMTHAGAKRFACEICGDAFARLPILDRHRLVHTGEKPFVCDICFRCFPTTFQLRRHKQTHTGVKPFDCKTCGVSFAQASHLKKHAGVVHGSDQSPAHEFRCDVCFQSFPSLVSLEKHGLKHGDVKPYKCETCGNCFSLLVHLKKHKLTHNPAVKKPFRCSTCERCFSQVASLKDHLNTHTGEKPYKCEKCGNAFGRFSSLYKHLRTHNRNPLAKSR